MSPRALARRGAESVQAYADVRAEAARALTLLRVTGWVVLHDVDDPAIEHVVVGPAGVFVVAGIRADEQPEEGGARLRDAAAAVGGALRAPVRAVLCVGADPGWAGRVGDVLVATPATVVEVLSALPATLDQATLGRVARALVTGARDPQPARPPVAQPQPAPESEPAPEPAPEPEPTPEPEPDPEPEAAAVRRAVPGRRRRAGEVLEQPEPRAGRGRHAAPPSGTTATPPVTSVTLARSEPPPATPATPSTSATSATPADPAPERRRRRAQRMGGRELVRWLVVVLVAGLVAIGALHGQELLDRGRALLDGDPPHRLGQTVHVAASTYHPPLDVRVDRVAPVRVTRSGDGVPAVAARVRIVNLGDRAWHLGTGASVRLVDEIGAGHAPAEGVRTTLARFPHAATVRPGAAVEGYAVFVVPHGRAAWQVRIRLAPTGEDTLVWQLPR